MKELVLYHVLLLVSSFLNKNSSKKHEESVFNPALVIPSVKNRPSYGTNKGTHKHTNTQVKRERIASLIRCDLTVVKKNSNSPGVEKWREMLQNWTYFTSALQASQISTRLSSFMFFSASSEKMRLLLCFSCFIRHFHSNGAGGASQSHAADAKKHIFDEFFSLFSMLQVSIHAAFVQMAPVSHLLLHPYAPHPLLSFTPLIGLFSRASFFGF